MRKSAFFATLAAGLLLALPAAAADSPLMAMFKDMCVSTRAAMEPSLAKGDAKGWQALPKEMFSGEEFKEMEKFEARYSAEGGGIKMLFVGVGKIDTEWGPTKVDICFVADSTADADALLKETQAFAGVQPAKGAGAANQTMWAYVDGPKGRVTAAGMSDADTAAAAKAGNARILLHQKETGLTMVGYAIPRL
ncbi:MAG TPA: hypothetical protein VEA44_01710 [Caulobacter sp.]|nr:hypothetical protein [Caulobacter sp.]